MQAKELMKVVSQQTGREVNRGHLDHAQRLGVVGKAPVRNGWAQYGEIHVEQLTEYMNTRARIARPINAIQ